MKYEKVTQKEIKFLRSNVNKMINRKLGEALGRNKNSIQGIMQYYGIKRSKKAIKKFRIENAKKAGLKGGIAGRKKIKYKLVSCIYSELSDCWECTSHAKNAYGYFYIGRNKKRNSMHRYIYEMYFNKIPKGMWVLHKCDNPSCINPDHLFLGTQVDNMQDMIKKGRQNYLQRLTKKEAIEIFESNERNYILAKKYKVCPRTIERIKRSIKKARTYKIVDDYLRKEMEWFKLIAIYLKGRREAIELNIKK